MAAGTLVGSPARKSWCSVPVPAIVVMSQVNGSSLSREAATELQKVADAYKAKGVLFYMVNSNLGATREQSAVEVAKMKTSIPVLMDEEQLVGREEREEVQGGVVEKIHETGSVGTQLGKD